jgi:hypothetical protein
MKTSTATKKIKEIANSDTTKKVLDKTNNIVSSPLFLKVLGGGILFFAGYKLITTITKKVAGEEIDNNVGGTGGTTENSTITDTEANNYAQQLLDAFNYKVIMYGTDDATILSVFNKLLTPDDFIKVYHAFGEKDYNGYNSPPTGAWSWLDSYEKRNLVYWLQEELSDSTGDEVYTKVKAVVESAGFTFN